MEFFVVVVAMGWLVLCAAIALSVLKLADRWLRLLERAAERQPVTRVEPLPLDLMAYSNQEESPWAREDMRKHLHELYQELGDWNKVRHTVLQENP